MEYVTAVPTNAKPAKNGHIFLPSRAAVRKNDSDAYGIVLFYSLSVCLCDTCASLGKKTNDARDGRGVIGEKEPGSKTKSSPKIFHWKKTRIASKHTHTHTSKKKK